jgi:hypothetical protein
MHTSGTGPFVRILLHRQWPLQVCHESRQEALKHYILSFGTTTHPPTIYFNYQIDTLCFGNGINRENQSSGSTGPSNYLLKLWHGKAYTRHVSKAAHTKNIRFVALDVDNELYDRPTFCWEEIRLFDGSEELLLITWDPEERMIELMAYFATTLTAVAEAYPKWVVPKTEVVCASGSAWGSLQPGAPAQILSV